jgi:hypothetical protein
MSNVLQFPTDYLVIDGGRISDGRDWFWIDRVVDGESRIIWSGRYYEGALAFARVISHDERLRVVDRIEEARR